MSTGTIFIYLLIAAMVAPFAWVLWWGAASLNEGRVAATPTRMSRRTTVRRSSIAPYPVDLTLPSRRHEVTVYSASGTELSTCLGPDAGGRCPQPLADGTVPCAGCMLALPRPIRGSFEWQIPSGYRACLLGSYDVFRQASPAS
jgi:hypothetical protein